MAEVESCRNKKNYYLCSPASGSGEMVDALVSGASVPNRRVSSSLISRTANEGSQ